LTLPAGQPSPPSTNPGLFSRIVCGVDLVPSSAIVMQQAVSLAWETEGWITYVCVVPEDTSLSSAELREELLAAIPPEAKRWCTTDVVIARGVASDVIMKMAVELNAELVVIGAPRRSTSTTHAVISRALCPVLVTHDVRPLPRPSVSEKDGRDRLAV
jgi:nucleotide-binding universal stress UspA family protein